MKEYKGKSVFGGIAIGRIKVYNKSEQQVKRVHVDECFCDIFILFRYYSLLLRGNINFLYCHAAIVCSFCDDLYDISTVKLFSIFQV